MKQENLYDLYILELRDLYSAEDQILSTLPKVIEKTDSADLRKALQVHLEETREHATRLERIFEMHAVEVKKQKCKGMHGILEEGDELIGKDATPQVRDAAIISACQRVEHYEIAGYGTVRTYAEQLGLERAAALLADTLKEEKHADETLTEIANSRVNVQARRTA